MDLWIQDQIQSWTHFTFPDWVNVLVPCVCATEEGKTTMAWVGDWMVGCNGLNFRPSTRQYLTLSLAQFTLIQVLICFANESKDANMIHNEAKIVPAIKSS